MDLRTPKNVMKGAEGFYLKGNETGVILIHGGGGGTAADMRELGKFIHEKTGYSVFAPLLPGFGTKKEDLYNIQIFDWIDSLKRWFLEFKQEVNKIFLLGHSMGGVLALYLAGEFANDVAGIIAISTPMKLKGFLIKLIPFFRLFIKYWKVNDLEEFKKISNGIWVGYESIPLNLISKFNKLMRMNNAQLERIKAPILIIQGTKDQFVSKKDPVTILNKVSSTDKSIIWFDTTHEILFSKVKLDFFSKIVEFLQSH
ncbi:MAG: alpha/beta hydrolase [Candidatus Helarchaeota archaeon]